MPWTLIRAMTLAGAAVITVAEAGTRAPMEERPTAAAPTPVLPDAAVRASVPVAPAAFPSPATPKWTRRRILDALRSVESGRASDVGDDGRAVGPYQIWESYWRDAVDEDPSLAWIGVGASRRRARHADCRDPAYAEDVVGAFMRRHAPAAWAACDAETIARVHNGGPRGPRRASTAAYWARVQAALR